MGTTIQVETNATNVPLELTVDKINSGGITGLSPTVAVRTCVTGTPSYLDWNDTTFKTSSWGSKYQIMTEIELGHYQWILNISTLALAAGTQLSAEYYMSSSGLVGVDADIISVVNVGQNAKFLRQVATNRLEEAAGNPGTLILYDDGGSTPLMTWDLLDSTGGAVTATAGSPARRAAGV